MAQGGMNREKGGPGRNSNNQQRWGNSQFNNRPHPWITNHTVQPGLLNSIQPPLLNNIPLPFSNNFQPDFPNKNRRPPLLPTPGMPPILNNIPPGQAAELPPGNQPNLLNMGLGQIPPKDLENLARLAQNFIQNNPQVNLPSNVWQTNQNKQINHQGNFGFNKNDQGNNLNQLGNQGINHQNQISNQRMNNQNQPVNQRFNNLNQLGNQRFNHSNQLNNQRFNYPNQLNNQRFNHPNQLNNQRFNHPNQPADQRIHYQNQSGSQRIGNQNQLSNQRTNNQSLPELTKQSDKALTQAFPPKIQLQTDQSLPVKQIKVEEDLREDGVLTLRGSNDVCRGARESPTQLDQSPLSEANETDAEAKQNAAGPDTPVEPKRRGKRIYKQRRRRPRMRKKDPDFAGVRKEMVSCLICDKRFNSSKDFRDHVGGKPHREEVRAREQRYIRELQELRREAKVIEHRKQWDMKKRGETRMLELVEVCPVCDLQYVGCAESHEKEETHQKLKPFYKPECKDCNLTFMSRILYDNHMCTVEHIQTAGLAEYNREQLKKQQAAAEATSSKATGDQEVKIKQEKSDDTLNRTIEPNEGKAAETVLAGSDQMNKSAEKCQPEIAPQEASVDEEAKRDQRKRKSLPLNPPYDPDVPFGMEAIVPKSGFMCSTCHLFLPTDHAVRVHTTGKNHYDKHMSKLAKRRRESLEDNIHSTEPKSAKPAVSRKETDTFVNLTKPESAKPAVSRNETNTLCDLSSPFTRERSPEPSSSPLLPQRKRYEIVDLDDDDKLSDDDGNWKRQRRSFETDDRNECGNLGSNNNETRLNPCPDMSSNQGAGQDNITEEDPWEQTDALWNSPSAQDLDDLFNAVGEDGDLFDVR